MFEQAAQKLPLPPASHPTSTSSDGTEQSPNPPHSTTP
jgi:hypothetical protein